MNFLKTLKELLIGFIVGIFSDPEDSGLKAERVQFWDDTIDPAWQKEKGDRALTRTFTREASRSARDLAKSVTGELEPHGYHPDAVEVTDNTVTVRLTTTSVGRLTERDYAAAALIDLTL